MGRSPARSSSEKDEGLKKGPWSKEEDKILVDYIRQHGGHGSWQLLPQKAGLNRCGKSCRLRWINYLRPDIKRGNFSIQEEQIIIDLHLSLGNKWSMIASQLPGRTDNEIKNYWNTHLRKKLLHSGIDPVTHLPMPDLSFQDNSNITDPQEYLTKLQLLHSILQMLNQLNTSFDKTLFPTSNHQQVLGNVMKAPEISGMIDVIEDAEVLRLLDELVPTGSSELSMGNELAMCSSYAAMAKDDDDEQCDSFWRDVFVESFLVPSLSD